MTDDKMGEVMKQAKLVQEQMTKAQEELMNLLVTGESGAGMVKVAMNGRHDAKSVEIDPSLQKESISVLQDLIQAAINDAVQKVEQSSKEKIAGLAAGFGQMPFDLGGMFKG